MNIVLHSDDLLLLDHWEKSIEKECRVVDTLEELYKVKESLVIINYLACKPSCEEVLKHLSTVNKVLVLHRVPDMATAKYILSLGAKGYGNALMRGHFLQAAVEAIQENMLWLHPEFITALIKDIPNKKENQNLERLNILTDREKEVASFLKDGDTYKCIAKKLLITPRTVKEHAKHIYEKLSVKDRLGLALLLK